MTILTLQLSRGRQRGLELGQARSLETGHGEEDVAERELPNVPLKKLWCSEGEESETHSSIRHPSMRGALEAEEQVELPNNSLWGLGSRSFKDKAPGKPL